MRPAALSAVLRAGRPTADPAVQATAQPAGPPVAAPFVGPRPYAIGESLFGRDRERLELLDLVIAERIVLLYSPSGAGKTSLVQAACVPALRKQGFAVPGVARVTFDSPGEAAQPAANRYVFALLLSLEEGRLAGDQLPVSDLARMTLPEYLEYRCDAASDHCGLVLILDQFEEILTIDQTDIDAKREFFTQLGQALRNRNRWALLCMREEHIAGLDPFRSLVPTRLSTTYRLDLLTEQQARQAMQQAAAQAGVTFTDGAARRLVDDLRRVRVERPGHPAEEQPGPTVEPTQLQVVCLRLWGLLGGKTTIEEIDVAALGSADTALADYYAEIVGRLYDRERFVRDWIEEKLITADGLRNQVQRDHAVKSQGVEEREIALLAKCYLIREERRRGIGWLELAHDRLIEPICNDNARWRERHLTRLQWAALYWDRYRHPALELSGKGLADAEKWADAHDDELTSAEKELLKASRQSRRRRRNRLIVLAGCLAFTAAAVAYWDWLGKRPWAHWTDLRTGQPYELSHEIAPIGDMHEGPLASEIPLEDKLVSRLHLFVTQNLQVHDLRSAHGTTVNARLLIDGKELQLADGDLLVIAGIAPFRFSPIKPSYVPFTHPKAPPVSRMPDGTWGMFIDGPSRTAQPLVNDEYFVEAATGGQQLRLTKSASPGSLLKITRPVDGGSAEIEAVYQKDGDTSLITTLKVLDMYAALKIPSGARVADYIRKDVFGYQYVSKLSFCFAAIQGTEYELEGVKMTVQVISGDEPKCTLGPFQVVSFQPPKSAPHGAAK